MESLLTRVLTFAGTTIAIEHTAGRSSELVEFLFERVPYGSAAAEPHARVRLTEDPESGVFTVWCNGRIRCADRSAGVAAGWLLRLTCSQLAEGATQGLLFHAGLVTAEGRGLLLPAPSGSGKSTLSAFLTSRGFDYVTDEAAFVLPSSTDVDGFTAPLKIKDSGLAVIDAHHAGRPESCGRLTGLHEVLIEGRGPRGTAPARPLALILFPRYRRDARFVLRAMSPAQTGLRLLASLQNAARLPDGGFFEATRLARLVPGFEMGYGDFEQVEARLAWLRDTMVRSERRAGRRTEADSSRSLEEVPPTAARRADGRADQRGG